MGKKVKRLGDAELQIMMVLWNEAEPVTSKYILEQIYDTRKWALSTLMSTLTRLEVKGYVSCDRMSRTNYYTAIIPAEEYKTKESISFLERLYGNSLSNLVMSLYNSNTINKKDLTELRELINNLERRNPDG